MQHDLPNGHRRTHQQKQNADVELQSQHAQFRQIAEIITSP
jgi:hypothetical protein